MGRRRPPGSREAPPETCGVFNLPTVIQAGRPGDACGIDYPFDSTMAGKPPVTLSIVDEREEKRWARSVLLDHRRRPY